jgi:hypothetical protein
VEAFDTKGRDELSRFEGIEGRRAVWWQGEMSWVSGLETSEDIDLRVCKCNS